jgi:hypothetical protein
MGRNSSSLRFITNQKLNWYYSMTGLLNMQNKANSYLSMIIQSS